MLPYEKEILSEAEGLDHLSKLFQGFDTLLEEALLEYDTLDPNLVMLCETIRYDINLLLSESVTLDDGTKIPGILKQLEDVMDEVQTLDCGGKTKDGIPDED